MTLEQKIGKILRKKSQLNNMNFNWYSYSSIVAKYCPQYIDPKKFNWKNGSSAIAQHCPKYFDTNKYNWEFHSWAVIAYCPEKADINKINLENILISFPQYKDMSLKEIKERAILSKL